MTDNERKKLIQETNEKDKKKIIQFYDGTSTDVAAVKLSTMLGLKNTIEGDYKFSVECKNKKHIMQAQGNKIQCAFAILRLLEAFDDEEFYKTLWRVLTLREFETWAGNDAVKETVRQEFETSEEADVVKAMYFMSDEDLETIKEHLNKK